MSARSPARKPKTASDCFTAPAGQGRVSTNSAPISAPVIWSCGSSFLVDFDSATELLILVADELDELAVRHDALIDAHRPRLRVRLRIVHGHVNLEVRIVQTPEALGELRLLTVRAAVDVEPSIVRAIFGAAQVVGFNHERIAFPATNRVAIPPRLRLTLRRQLTAIEIDVADAVVRLVLNDDHLR